MTTQERKVIELALNALQTLHDENMDYLTRNKLGGENNQCMVFARDVIKSIKRALAQPEQEYGVVAGVGKGVEIPAGVKYYYIEPKLPPQRQPLKYEEYSALAETYTIDYGLLDCVDNHLYKPPTALRNKT